MVTAQVDSRAGGFVFKAERECGWGGQWDKRKTGGEGQTKLRPNNLLASVWR